MTTSSQPPTTILPPSGITPYSKPSSSASSRSSSQSSSKPAIPQIIFEDPTALPAFPEETGPIQRPTKKHRTYSDMRRRGSSRLTLDELPGLEVLEPEPVLEDDEEDIGKLRDGERPLDNGTVTPFLDPSGGYADGEDLRRTTTAPALSRPMSHRRERLAPGEGVSWPRVRRLGMGMRSKTQGVEPFAPNKLI